MKVILYIFGGLIVLGVIISFVFSSMPVFPMAGKGFLNSIKVGQYSQAYELFTPQFKENYSLEDFIRFTQQSGLNRYRDVNWSKHETSKDRKTGYIIGRVVTADQKIIPIRINFVMEEGETWFQKGWRIASIELLQTKPSTAPTESGQPVAPDQPEPLPQ